MLGCNSLEHSTTGIWYKETLRKKFPNSLPKMRYLLNSSVYRLAEVT